MAKKISKNKLLEMVGDYKIVLMSGLPGSGKSYWARKIAKKNGAKVLRSDDIREEMFGTTRLDLAGDDVVREQSRKAYEEMYKRAKILVENGRSVIVDATHLKSGRKAVVDDLLQVVDELLIVVVRTSTETMAKRMKKVKEMANEKESAYDGWRRVMGYFEKGLAAGEYTWPDDGESEAKVVEVNND